MVPGEGKVVRTGIEAGIYWVLGADLDVERQRLRYRMFAL